VFEDTWGTFVTKTGNFDPPPPHPAIASEPYLTRRIVSGKEGGVVVIRVRCPICEQERERPNSEIKLQMQKYPHWKGFCSDCRTKAIQSGTHRFKRDRRSKDVSFNPKGYALVPAHTVPDEFLPMFRQMQKHGQPLLQHRWLLALHLGRPLESYECVDHMDGNKTNNEISNLRIYIKGKNHPGSIYGYGTYYHEWQMALARIRELEEQLNHPPVAVMR
jgi:hypothetical protein